MVLRHYLTQCWNIVNWTLRNSETVIGIQSFSFKKTHLKMLSVKWHQFCLGLNLSKTTCISYVHLIPWLSGSPVNKLHPEAQHSGNKTIIYTGHNFENIVSLSSIFKFRLTCRRFRPLIYTSHQATNNSTDTYYKIWSFCLGKIHHNH